MSAMFRNTEKLASEMLDSNRNHAKDLQGAFFEVQKFLDLPKARPAVLENDDSQALTVKSNRDFLNKRKSGQRPEKINRHRSAPEDSAVPEPEFEEPPKKVVRWAKTLYRSIVLLTHPDKIQSQKNWSALKREKHAQIGLDVVDAYSGERFAELIALGCEIDVFSKELSVREQMAILNREYSVQIQQIDSVQESLAWKWGSFWTQPADRIKILQRLCINSGFQPPAVDKIEEILKNLDFID